MVRSIVLRAVVLAKVLEIPRNSRSEELLILSNVGQTQSTFFG
jgi:hypothetical protein